MPEQDELTPSPEATVEASAPTWLNLVAGFSFVATVAVLAGILLVRFVQERPVNIEKPSAQLAGVIERALRDNFVPSSAISSSSSVVKSDNGNRWTYSRFDVTVPPRLDAAGIASLLGDKLRTYNLTITSEAGEQATQELKIWLSNYEVASVALTPATSMRPEAADWRNESRELASAARKALDSLGVPMTAIFQDSSETREDADARWDLARIEVRMPSPPEPADLASAIESTLTLPEVAAHAGMTPTGGEGVVVSLRGRTAVEVELESMPGTMPGPLAAVPLDTQPDLFRLLDSAFPPGTVRTDFVDQTYPAPFMPESAVSSELLLPRDSGEGDGHMEMAKLAEPPGPRSRQDVSEPRVAILLDDGGYGGKVSERILAMDPRLTLAILPNTPDGKTTAARAKELGFEVILHMPMQTSSASVKKFPGQLEIGMPREQIAQLTTDAMDQVPEAVGVNNHTGSKYTSNAEAMALFLETVKAKNWFFIDSVTGPDSKAWEVAHSMGIPAARRDVFLDDVADAGEIRRQWAEMVRIARKTGTAIAIGHFRPLTIDVIEKELPKLEASGITLVHVSELVR